MKYFCWLLILILLPLIASQKTIGESLFVNNQQYYSVNYNQRVDFRAIGNLSNNATLKEDKAMSEDIVMKVVLALLFSRSTYVSQFPTASTLANISEQCKIDSQIYYNAFIDQEKWALRMQESTGKAPEGIHSMEGTYNALRSYGLFDECIDTRGPVRPNAKDRNTLFDGKYCSVFFTIVEVKLEDLENSSSISVQSQKRSNWITVGQWLQWVSEGPSLLEPKVGNTGFFVLYLPGVDFCIPSSCNYEDFRQAVAEFVGKKVIYSEVDVFDQIHYYSISTHAGEDWCHTRDSVDATPFDAADIAVIVMLSCFGLVVSVASCHEAWRLSNDRPINHKQDGLAVRCLHCFSVISNGKSILSTKSQPGNVTCLNGLRFISTTWVVMGHSLYVISGRSMYNLYQLYDEAMTWSMQGITNATVVVDTFFMMSGLLVCYLLLRELERNNGRFNVPLFYIHRYLRLTPVYAVIVGFVATLLVYVSNGPNWRIVHYMSDSCRSYWWLNLLYINNIINLNCMGETWYLSCDMQMFLVSPLLIWPLWRWRRAGVAWVLINIIGFTGGIMAIYIIWDLPATSFGTRPVEMSNPHWTFGYYVTAWPRFPPYLIGILFGWLLHQTKNTKIIISRIAVAIGWTLATIVALFIIYGLTPYLDENQVPEMNEITRVSYGAFHRLAWSISLGWLIFACVHGYGGPVNRFLSWRAFIPLSRLTYVVYLIHLEYLYMWSFHLRKPIYFTLLDYFQLYFGALLGLHLLAFFISVTVEVPFLNLEKLIFSNTKASVEKDFNKKYDEMRNSSEDQSASQSTDEKIVV